MPTMSTQCKTFSSIRIQLCLEIDLIDFELEDLTTFVCLCGYRDQCKTEFCASLCIKDELGEDDDKKGKWTSIFARAPLNSESCLDACYSGCQNIVLDDD